MSNIFEKWNSQIDADAFSQEVAEIDQNGGTGTFEELPVGNYEVKVEKMEIKASKKGDPMFACRFKVVNGQHKGRLLFMNQVILQPFQVHIVNDFLRSLVDGFDIDVRFDGNYSHYNDLVLDIMEAIDGQCEYELAFTKSDKGYNQYEIVNIFDVEGSPALEIDSDDLPF